jgi:Cu2+-exporting ATPase
LALAPADRDVLYNMAARSTHPKSVAVTRALGATGTFQDLDIVERAGDGLEFATPAGTYRFGHPTWAMGTPAQGADLVFSKDRVLLAAVTTTEQMRPDAAREVSALQAQGYDVWILSGDSQERVDAMADTCGVPRAQAVGGRSAEGKARWLTEHDAKDTLVVGDGINDSLVVAQAFCSGTPAVDRPFMAQRTDFYFVTPGLAPIGLALRSARALARVVHRNLTVAVVYNMVTVGLAYAGLVSPLLCAILMPLSSLSTIAVTTASLSKRSRLWKS